MRALKLAQQKINASAIDRNGFTTAIISVNRSLQQEIAKLKTAVYIIRDRLGNVSESETHRLHLQIDDLQSAIKLKTQQLITAQAHAFTKVYQKMVRNYQSQESVVGNVDHFSEFLGLHSALEIRSKLEKTGKRVDIPLDLFIKVPAEQKNSKAFKDLCSFLQLPFVSDEKVQSGSFRSNFIYRRCFLHYALQRNPLETRILSRPSFLKFVKDFQLLHLDASRAPLLEEDAHMCLLAVEKRYQTSGLTFDMWIDATCLLLQRIVKSDSIETLFQSYIYPRASKIQSKSTMLGPEFTQSTVIQGLRSRMWPLKQIFSHFTRSDMYSIQSGRTMSFREFLRFARCFDFVRHSHDGQSPHVIPVSHTLLHQLSIPQVMWEMCLAKWEVRLASNICPEAYDSSPSLTFHEFLRTLQRLSLVVFVKHEQEDLGLAFRKTSKANVDSTLRLQVRNSIRTQEGPPLAIHRPAPRSIPPKESSLTHRGSLLVSPRTRSIDRSCKTVRIK